MTSCGVDPEQARLGAAPSRRQPAACDGLPAFQAKPKTSQVFAAGDGRRRERRALRIRKCFDGSDGRQAHQDHLERDHLSTIALIAVGNVV
jgi:hypothetical protein